MILTSSCTSATQQDPAAQKVEDINLSASLSHSCHFPRIPSSVKRKLEMFEDQCVPPPPKISLTRKWQPPPFSKKEAKQSASIELKTARPTTPNIKLFGFVTESLQSSSEASGILEEYQEQPAPKQNHQPCKQKRASTAHKESSSPSVFQSLGKIKPKFVSDRATKLTRTLHEDIDGGKTPNKFKARYSTALLTSDPRVKDCGLLNTDEQNEMLEKAKGAKAVMLTLVSRDGSCLLDQEHVSHSCSTVCTLHLFIIFFHLNKNRNLAEALRFFLKRKGVILVFLCISYCLSSPVFL